MKIRLKFEKNNRYISHLDLMKAFQKLLKRSGLRLKYSEGFNPHIILSIANPLPVGVRGVCEYADFEILDTEITPAEIFGKLMFASPISIKPLEIYISANKSFNLTEYAKYEIEIQADDFSEIEEFFTQDEIFTEKKSKGNIKTINLKEYIKDYSFSEASDGVKLNLICSCGNTRNLNPILIKKTFDKSNIKYSAFLPTRTALFDGELRDTWE